MKNLSELPFINISKENLEAASDMLDREQKGELMEMIIDAVLNDASPNSDDRYVNGVFNQFMSVIERRAKGYATRIDALDKINGKKKKVKEIKEQEAFSEDETMMNLINVPEGVEPIFGYMIEEPIYEPIPTEEVEQPTNNKNQEEIPMVTKEELIKTYEKCSKNDFERCCNYFVSDFNVEAKKNGTKPTTFWKAIEAVVKNCGDKYNYMELIESRRDEKCYDGRTKTDPAPIA